MAWLPSRRKEVWESRGWRGRWRRQGERGGRWGGRVERALEMLKNRGGEWEEKGTGGDVLGKGGEGLGTG